MKQKTTTKYSLGNVFVTGLEKIDDFRYKSAQIMGKYLSEHRYEENEICYRIMGLVNGSISVDIETITLNTFNNIPATFPTSRRKTHIINGNSINDIQDIDVINIIAIELTKRTEQEIEKVLYQLV